MKIKETLGKGAFCKVKKGEGTFLDDEDKPITETYALKVYSKPKLKKKISSFHDAQGLLQMKTVLDQVYNEIALWERVDCAQVCKIFELLDDFDSDNMYLIMQYSDLGQLSTWNSSKKCFERNKEIERLASDAAEMKYFDVTYPQIEKTAKHIFRQVADGIKYLHEEAFIGHRDLKLENILIGDDFMLKIADFGFATSDNTNASHKGT